MERITQKMVENQLRFYNLAMGRSPVAWTRKGTANVASVGTFVLDAAYGGYRVAELCNEGGGERDAFHGYRMSARECYYCLKAAVETARMMLGENEFHKRLNEAID